MNVSMNTSSMYSYSASQMPPPPPPPPGGSDEDSSPFSTENILTNLDSDESGGLSLEEVSDSPLSNFISEDNWSDVDTDGDGSLSLSELEAHRETVTPPGLMSAASSADPMAMFESLLDSVSNSEAATDTTAAYAEDLYAAMDSLLNSLTV